MIAKTLQIIYLEDTNYEDILLLQRELRDKRIAGEINDCLLLVSHKPVFTLGKRGKYDNLLVSIEQLKQANIPIYEVERGGDITYHGPGQLVIYPIIDLKNYKRDLRGFVDKLQNSIITLLDEHYNISAHKEDGKHTGVWVKKEKIAAIGLSLRKWVTMHGMAFNINTDLSYFDMIVPCGLVDRGVTSIKQLKGNEVNFTTILEIFAKNFCLQLGCDGKFIALENIK
ncbi:MAG: lipoyl(octanoyl) transferase LipB [Clostridiales bacterium]|nr:lipoyl(octanoyl) transferase LipB [Clostridiales bacterium]